LLRVRVALVAVVGVWLTVLTLLTLLTVPPGCLLQLQPLSSTNAFALKKRERDRGGWERGGVMEGGRAGGRARIPVEKAK
jgi:hypothetical protein